MNQVFVERSFVYQDALYSVEVLGQCDKFAWTSRPKVTYYPIETDTLPLELETLFRAYHCRRAIDDISGE